MEITRETLSRLIRGSYTDLYRAAQNLGENITWQPLDRGRSALDQIQEAAGFALLGAEIFEQQAMPPFDPEGMNRLRANHDTPEKALTLLEEASAKLASALEIFPPEKLDHRIILPFGDGAERSFAEIAMLIYWNTVYHEGQVNYIETLIDYVPVKEN